MSEPAAVPSAFRPSYPTWQPGVAVLRRPSGAVQIGIDTPGAVLLEPVTPGLDRIVALLGESHHISVLRRNAHRAGVPPAQTDALVRRLVDAGLVEERRRRPGVSRTVRVIGAGPLGRAIACAVAEASVVRLELVDDEPVEPGAQSRLPGGGTRAEALRSALLQKSGATAPEIDIGTAWSVVGGRRPASASTEPDVTVVASDRLEVDRIVADGLLRADQPHLVVHGTGAGVAVGPFVLPGRTSCVRCTDLLRRDRDADWPSLLPQLCRLPAQLDPPLITWAAGMAVSQLMARLTSSGEHGPDTAGAVVELGRDYATSWRRWPAHPECGCHGVR